MFCVVVHAGLGGKVPGEVWVNGHYAGSYWEQNAQQSIQLPAETLQKGANSLTVFELKSNGKRTMRLSDKAIFN